MPNGAFPPVQGIIQRNNVLSIKQPVATVTTWRLAKFKLYYRFGLKKNKFIFNSPNSVISPATTTWKKEKSSPPCPQCVELSRMNRRSCLWSLLVSSRPVLSRLRPEHSRILPLSMVSLGFVGVLKERLSPRQLFLHSRHHHTLSDVADAVKV